MRGREFLTPRTVITLLSISVALWAYISIAFSLLARFPRYSGAHTAWNQKVGAGPADELIPLMVIVAIVLAMAIGQQMLKGATRRARLGYAFFLGLIGTATALPEILKYGTSGDIGEFILARTFLLFVGYTAASLACFYLVENSPAAERSRPAAPAPSR